MQDRSTQALFTAYTLIGTDRLKIEPIKAKQKKKIKI